MNFRALIDSALFFWRQTRDTIPVLWSAQCLGCTALTTAMIALRGDCFEPFDLDGNAQPDILDNNMFHLLLRVCWSGIVGAIWSAPPCKEFSRLKLRRPGGLNSNADHSNPKTSSLKPLNDALLQYLQGKGLVSDIASSLRQGSPAHPIPAHHRYELACIIHQHLRPNCNNPDCIVMRVATLSPAPDTSTRRGMQIRTPRRHPRAHRTKQPVANRQTCHVKRQMT